MTIDKKYGENMIFDTHIHTNASPDGKMTPEEAIIQVCKQGIGCIFTEHADYNPKGEPYFCTDLKKYPRDYIKYRSDTVLIGMEINLLAECVMQNKSNAAHPDIDYVIGSVHCTDGIDIGHDAAITAELFKRHGEEFYARYLAFSLEVIKVSDFFDAFGHIDFISRYSSLPESNALYEKFSDVYDAILTTLIEHGKLLELNTRRLREEGARKNLTAIYSRYRNLGGKYVTIGSDAHLVASIGNNFDIALEMLKEIGLSPVYFKERKMVVCEWD